MFYVVKSGKCKGKILSLDEGDFDHETGLVKAEDNKVYRIDDLRELTEEEKAKYLKVEEIQI